MKRDEFRIFPSGVAGITAVGCDTRHVFSRHTHEQFGIGVIDRGAQKSSSGRGMVEAGEGDTITVNPGEVHDGAPLGDAGRAWRMLYFDPPLIAQAAGDLSLGRTAHYEFARPALKDAAVAGCFDRLFWAVTDAASQRNPLRSEELLLTLLPMLLTPRPTVSRAVAKGVVTAKRLIDDCPTAPITLADLARVSGLSRFQVLRGLVQATGLTPHAYLVQRRIDLARRMIAAGTALAPTAAASGFADQSHMTRIFVRKYGLSPGAYAAAAA
ncbi:MAG TPA: AraC family transcriptional regulator [Xanthobacteraceae bacterium]|nr:AraC family transcriptional regulator [Xanthobacteraceae bacterium]